MSSIHPSDLNSQAVRKMWTSASSYIIPPVAAGVGFIPVSYGFIAKSAMQIQKSRPPINFEVFVAGCKAAPTVSAIVGSQIIAANCFADWIKSFTSDKTSINAKLAGAIITGAVSSPIFIIFQSQTVGISPMETIKSFRFNVPTFKKLGGATAIETTFLGGVLMGDFVGSKMEEYFGKTKAVAYGSTFMTGVFGSLLGHPFDTRMVCLIKNFSKPVFRECWRGAFFKAPAVGGFSVCYKIAKETLEGL